MIEFFKKISNKVKAFFAVLFAIICSFLFINYKRNSEDKKIKKLKENVASTKGENKILRQNNEANSSKIEDIDVKISEIKENIKNAEEEEANNGEDIDAFFDKRGF
tara:strand:- start:95 stop:412 length:318 start_codon:yes stop_codon:yes gene_type:complete